MFAPALQIFGLYQSILIKCLFVSLRVSRPRAKEQRASVPTLQTHGFSITPTPMLVPPDDEKGIKISHLSGVLWMIQMEIKWQKVRSVILRWVHLLKREEEFAAYHLKSKTLCVVTIQWQETQEMTEEDVIGVTGFVKQLPPLAPAVSGLN